MKDQEKPFNQSAYPIGKQIQMCEQGMTLRDHFAGLAMQYFVTANNGNFSENDASQIYYIADAMLKQRLI